MILYHFLWDLRFIAGFEINWYTQLPGKIWQASICYVFIFVSGFCLSLSRNPLKRGITVFASGLLVSVVTLIFIPENRVVFGVLTLIGSCMIIMSFADKIPYINKNKISYLTTSLLMFIITFHIGTGKIKLLGLSCKIPEYMYTGYVMTYLGFPFKSFYSTDYFPLIPWLFLFSAGYFSFKIAKEKDLLNCLKGQRFKVLSFIGKNTLIIYLFHQIILYGLTLLIMKFK